MRPFPLAVQKHGIDRLRYKGGASKEALYDLVNTRIDTAGGMGPRHGLVVDYELPLGTIGLYGFKGKLHVFANVPVAVANPRYQVNVLRHPTGASSLAVIHFVGQMLGRLYVTAEFANGDIFDYWLQNQAAWAASTIYTQGVGKAVQPIVANGFVYEITNAATDPTWAADAEHALSDYVLPSVPNGFKYQATAVAGAVPRSSATEPPWPTTEGATVTEYRSG